MERIILKISEAKRIFKLIGWEIRRDIEGTYATHEFGEMGIYKGIELYDIATFFRFQMEAQYHMEMTKEEALEELGYIWGKGITLEEYMSEINS